MVDVCTCEERIVRDATKDELGPAYQAYKDGKSFDQIYRYRPPRTREGTRGVMEYMLLGGCGVLGVVCYRSDREETEVDPFH